MPLGFCQHLWGHGALLGAQLQHEASQSVIAVFDSVHRRQSYIVGSVKHGVVRGSDGNGRQQRGLGDSSRASC